MSLMMDRCERSRHVIPNDGRTVRFDGTGGFVRDGWWCVSWDLAEREKKWRAEPHFLQLSRSSG